MKPSSMKTNYFIPKAARTDVGELIKLMADLADIEGYLDEFAVTPDELLRRGFPSSGAPQFEALVAERRDASLAGYAVTYMVPYTYDLKPTLVLKELFVQPVDRSRGVGELLFAAVRARAAREGCGFVKWAVLTTNVRAKTFYRRGGGSSDGKWEYWSWTPDCT
jgi:GNAT superfamily N-acetyltransferase